MNRPSGISSGMMRARKLKVATGLKLVTQLIESISKSKLRISKKIKTLAKGSLQSWEEDCHWHGGRMIPRLSPHNTSH